MLVVNSKLTYEIAHKHHSNLDKEYRRIHKCSQTHKLPGTHCMVENVCYIYTSVHLLLIHIFGTMFNKFIESLTSVYNLYNIDIAHNLRGRVIYANDLHMSTSKGKRFTYPNQGLTFSNIALDKQYIPPAAKWNFPALS